MNDSHDALTIKDLHVEVEGKEILKGASLTVRKGEVHALMGPNGSGKSTLAHSIMGHPRYQVTSGQVLFKGQDVLALTPDARARLGIFLAFQHPVAIPGVALGNFLRASIKAVRGNGMTAAEFRKLLKNRMDLLKMDMSFASRYVNEGFSGGEKKRAEILQMAMLNPEMAILDETDSGLDIDALRTVAEGVNSLLGQNMGVLIITHFPRILSYIRPDVVHVLYQGRVIRSGGLELAHQLEAEGYDPVIREYELASAVREEV